ncbi:MAG: methyltransferase domain-containing protein [bacterium]
MKILRKYAGMDRSDSGRVKLLRKRMRLFHSLISSLPKPVRILDVGGKEIFWERLGITKEKTIEITLVNLTSEAIKIPRYKSVVGDGRDMREYRDGQYDVVFSNSVIEHVGGFEDQKRMAEECRRVGKQYFIQTPNYYFPFEPHFLFPFFQFFPLWLKIFMIRHFHLGWCDKLPDRERAERAARSVRLLKKRELKELFPGATIHTERLGGWIYSFIVTGGGTC